MREIQKTTGKEGFKVNNIVRNARENDYSMNNPQSLKSMSSVNKQLTPLQTDAYQKSRGQLTFEIG